MIALDDLIQAALLATPDQKKEALRVLRGESHIAYEMGGGSPQEPYLTLKEVARRLGLNTTTLWRWQIPGHELAGRRRFKMSEVQAYLQSNEFRRRASALRAIRRSSKANS